MLRRFNRTVLTLAVPVRLLMLVRFACFVVFDWRFPIFSRILAFHFLTFDAVLAVGFKGRVHFVRPAFGRRPRALSSLVVEPKVVVRVGVKSFFPVAKRLGLFVIGISSIGQRLLFLCFTLQGIVITVFFGREFLLRLVIRFSWRGKTRVFISTGTIRLQEWIHISIMIKNGLTVVWFSRCRLFRVTQSDIISSNIGIAAEDNFVTSILWPVIVVISNVLFLRQIRLINGGILLKKTCVIVEYWRHLSGSVGFEEDRLVIVSTLDVFCDVCLHSVRAGTGECETDLTSSTSKKSKAEVSAVVVVLSRALVSSSNIDLSDERKSSSSSAPVAKWFRSGSAVLGFTSAVSSRVVSSSISSGEDGVFSVTSRADSETDTKSRLVMLGDSTFAPISFPAWCAASEVAASHLMVSRMLLVLFCGTIATVFFVVIFLAWEDVSKVRGSQDTAKSRLFPYKAWLSRSSKISSASKLLRYSSSFFLSPSTFSLIVNRTFSAVNAVENSSSA
uniref:Transmembrane protein n=1 Tax=Globisporangium ultimum (strain ATCC 200006 / CBS 805.95 / DAOM BR144) TaxID=431595 RepID=K3WK95_GLOUD